MGKEESPQISRRTTRLSSSCNTPNLKAPVEASKATNKLQSSSVDDLVFRGKTSIILQIFKHLNRPIIYSSCITCYNPRILFESILNQLLLHRKNESNGYLSAKRCEKPSDFVNLLREALSTLVDSLKGNPGKLSSKKSSLQVNGRMVYLIFDNLEVVREWDKSFSILPLLFNLYILKMPELGLIFISRTSLDTFQSDTGYVEPFPVYFPDYTEDDLRLIFMKNQANPKLYSSFLDVPSQPLLKASANKDRTLRKSTTKKLGASETLDEIDFHMSTSAKYLLISAFLASRNPATLDASLFDSTGGRTIGKEREKYLHDDEELQNAGLEAEGSASGLMSDILLQVSSLCSANFITKGGSCPLEGSTRYPPQSLKIWL
ncbi:UNVERIFIED_CONTAM: Origin of replication complex subunit [Sesamum radiatum]|uniref:Origin of replication complex subunit n=1 Tax=Sesamum radiatum TaxID=300843 RepID=A0AAW2V9L9_SESRA